jgi:hypothetical protein
MGKYALMTATRDACAALCQQSQLTKMHLIESLESQLFCRVRNLRVSNLCSKYAANRSTLCDLHFLLAQEYTMAIRRTQRGL